MPGASFNGICYPTVLDATNAFYAKFPMLDLTGGKPFLTSIATATPSASGVTFTVSTKDLTKGTIVVSTPTPLIFPVCTGSIFDPLLAASFWSFAIVFVVSSWLLAKNAGVIISAVRRF